MKPIYKNILISLAGALVGALVVLAALKSSPTFRERLMVGSPSQHNLIDNVAKEQRALTERFNDFFSDEAFGPANNFAVDDIAKREDAKYVYYDVNIPDLKSTNLNTRVEDGFVIIT